MYPLQAGNNNSFAKPIWKWIHYFVCGSYKYDLELLMRVACEEAVIIMIGNFSSKLLLPFLAGWKLWQYQVKV